LANGKKTEEKSLGRRFVEWKTLASRYPDDPEKAKLQEDRVADMIDFFVPQSKEDVALEAAFALVPGVSGKMVGKGAKIINKKVPEVVEYLKDYISSPKFQNALDNFTDSWDETIDLQRSYLKRLDEIDDTKIGDNTIISSKDINKKRPEYLKDVEGNIDAVWDPTEDKIFLNRNTIKDIDERSAIPLLAEEFMHYVTYGNTKITPKMKAVMKENQWKTPKHGKYIRSYRDGDVPRISAKSAEYAQDPTETYSKIMATRATGGLQPGRTIREIDIPKQSVYKPPEFKGINEMANEALQDLKHGYTNRQIANLMTKLPIVTPNITEKDLKDIEILEP